MTALFSSQKEKQINKVVLIPIDNIIANSAQPRKFFDEPELLALGESIKVNGLIQPISVRRLDDKSYQLIAGERRLRACKLVGITHVECIIIDADAEVSAILALVENLQRKDLNFFEEANAIQGLIQNLGLTQEQAAHKLSVAQSTIANKLRLLRLLPEEQKLIIGYGLTERHARCLLKLVDAQQRAKAIQTIVNKKLNVVQSEHLVDTMLNIQKPEKKSKKLFVVKDVRIFFNSISKAIETMNKSGIPAVTEVNEKDEYLEYVVKIPKTAATKGRKIS